MKAAITLLTSLVINNINAKTVDESATGALLSFPSVADGPLYGKAWDVAPAQFGYQNYGGKFEGTLVLPKNATYHKECPVTDRHTEPNQAEPLDSNPYIHYIQDWFISDNDIRDYILVIDRLDCYFVDKIKYAQDMGASGVIMCDWQLTGSLFTMWMPQDWTDNINIPSVLLNHSNCAILMSHIGVQNWDPNHPQNMIYPTVETINWTVATIEWGLPHPDDRVEYELWTSSNDYLGSQFKHNFNTTAIRLDEAGDTQFTPHMYILNGSHWNCDNVFNGNATLPCGDQCTNNGRYCAIDPEYDTSIGLSGADVIQENLRSLCVWQYDKEEIPGNDDIVWWDYAVLWDENCGVYSNTSKNFHANCSFAQMDKLKPDQSLSNYVRNKIQSTGGYGLRDGVNSMLKTETKLKYNSSIYAIPMVRVNEFLIHGNIDCEPPITVATCEVLAAICAGFINDDPDKLKPDVCYVTPAPSVAVCEESDKDCNGTCFGRMLVDGCDQCLLVSSHKWNECIGCNGVVNGTYDCEGNCGGHYGVSYCGYCKDTRQKNWYTFAMDCIGGCDTSLKKDECDQCIEESDTSWNNCLDCESVPNGGKKNNVCGFCIDPNAPGIDFENYGKDCRGICEGGYTKDECGQCLSTDDGRRNDCVGCDNVAHSGKELNECNRCVKRTDPHFNDYGRDCRGICSTSVADTYYEDECGHCLLPSDASWNECIDNTEVPDLRKKEAELTTVIVIVCIVAFLIIIAACLIIGALWKKQTSINARFDSLAATYVHMDENPQHNFPVSTKQGMQTINSDPDSGGEN